jgi:hypothetical protein
MGDQHGGGAVSPGAAMVARATVARSVISMHCGVVKLGKQCTHFDI